MTTLFSYQFPVIALIGGVLAAFVAYLGHYLYLQYRVGHSLGKAHYQALRHAHWHLLVGVVVALLLGTFVGYRVAHSLAGFKFNPYLHIRPNPLIVKAGAGAPQSFSLGAFLPSTVLDQGQSNACVAFSMTLARWIEDKQRGDTPPDVFSGFYTYYWAAGGQNVPTSIDQEGDALINHGVTLLGNQPYFGVPPQAAVSASVERGGTYNYLFYGAPGQAGLDAMKAEIASGTPVVLLIGVYPQFQFAYGKNVTDNSGGSLITYHAIVAYGYEGNAFLIRNSWGPGFGSGGSILLSEYAMRNTVVGAAITTPSPQKFWQPVLKPKPIVPSLTPNFTANITMYLRSQPLARTKTSTLITRGQKLSDQVKRSGTWVYVSSLDRKHRGWVPKDNLCPALGCPRLTVKIAVGVRHTPDPRTPGFFLLKPGQIVENQGKSLHGWVLVWYSPRVLGWVPRDHLK